MKILHYLRRIRLEDGGVVRAVVNLTAQLCAHGQDVTLATVDDQDAREAFEGAPAMPRIVRLEGDGGIGGRLGRAQRASMERLVREADIIHVHSMWTTSNVQVARVARARARPYIYSIHGMLDDWCMSQRTRKKKLYLAFAGRRALEGAAFVHCTAQGELEQARQWFPGGRGHVVPLICETEPYRALPEPGEAAEAFPDVDFSRPSLLYLSRLHYKKGPDVFIEAGEILARQNRTFNLLLAGTGDAAYERELKTLAGERGGHARFLGFVSGRAKVALLSAADLVIIPTSQENFGFVFFECLLAGTALVTTKGTDTWPELVESGGAVMAQRDAPAIAAAAGELMDDPDRMRSMGQAGRAWALEHLQPGRVIDEFVRMYAEAVEGAQ